MKRKISSTVSNVLWQIYGSKDSPCFDCFFFVLFLLHVFIYEFVFPLCFSLSALLESQKKVFIQSFAACGFHEILSLAVCFWYFASGFDFCLLLFIFFVSIQLQLGGCYLFACFVYFCFILLHRIGDQGEVRLVCLYTMVYVLLVFFFLFISSSVNTNTDYI